MSHIFLLTFVVLYGLIYFYTNEKKIVGSFKVYDDKIGIVKEQSEMFFINEIEGFEIQRGSTYHYADQSDNKIVKIGNYIRFKKEDKFHEFEFLIDSKQKNVLFESLIYTLKKK